MRAIFRFSRDLRLEDHAGLAEASKYGEIVPAVVIDETMQRRIGSSPRRAACYCGCVKALAQSLDAQSSRLIVRRGDAATILLELAKATEARAVVWTAEYDAPSVAASNALRDRLKASGLGVEIVHDAPAIAPERTSQARQSSGEGYRAFAPFFDVWRELEIPSYEAPLFLSFAKTSLKSDGLPQPSQFGSKCDPPPACGESEARKQLDRFLRGDGLQYTFALNLPADDRTSHLSAALTFGSIAARTVVRETRHRIDDPFLLAEERNSLRLFLRSLAMRDFFLQLAHYNPQIFEGPLQEKMRDFPFAQDHPGLQAWREGKTGYPIVDAGIRQLRETGWMHPHARSIAASFLCFDLGIDWRIGLREWDGYLTEDDPALSVGNWQWIAGVGADLAAYPRIYNPEKQARRYDPQHAYARRWIAEFAHANGSAAAPDPLQPSLPFYGGVKYPQPVVDHERAAREFLERYRSFTQATSRQASY